MKTIKRMSHFLIDCKREGQGACPRDVGTGTLFLHLMENINLGIIFGSSKERGNLIVFESISLHPDYSGGGERGNNSS
jgi:hypothetical protein